MEESGRLILGWRLRLCGSEGLRLFSQTDHELCTLHILMSFIPMLGLGTC
jgi:hypothetical protein